jgi:hypothetical protein
MNSNTATSIRSWIKMMGFKLSKSHKLTRSAKKIKYYTLDNFGIYEEVPISKTDGKPIDEPRNKRYFSWTPWGDTFEVTSVRDISKAYADFMHYNPTLS